MKKEVFIFVALFLACILRTDLTDASERSLMYHTYAGAGEPVMAETTVRFKDLPGDQTSIIRKKHAENCITSDEFILDRDYSSESWKRISPGDDTDLISVREGDVWVVKGKLKGKMIDKQIKLKGKALYIYPKYNLSKFALSDMKKIKFWTLRRDLMSKLPMKAEKKGIKTIVVNGKEVEAIMVYYSITGKLREKHFNHNYYYRKSDGLYIKKEELKGIIEELVKEE